MSRAGAADKKKASAVAAAIEDAAEAAAETPAAAAEAIQDSPEKTAASAAAMVTPARTSVVDKLEKAREGEEEGTEKRRRHGWVEPLLILADV